MGLLDFLFGSTDSSKKSSWEDADQNEDWFEHASEDHDEEDGYCSECEEEEDDLE